MATKVTKKSFIILSGSKNLQPFLKGDLAPLLVTAAVSEKNRSAIILALGEAITNCMRHSYQGKSGEKIVVTVEDHGAEMTFRVRDYGLPADIEKIRAKLTPTLPPQRPGGLGVYFIKTVMDKMEYNPSIRDGNELLLTKKK